MIKSINEAFEKLYEDNVDVVIPDDMLKDPKSFDLKDVVKLRQKEADDAKRDAELAEKRKELQPLIDEISASSDKFETMFDKLVPSNGMADTLAGEYIRAMMRILYRDYNDGDVFYDGYGLETCGSSAEFLMDSGLGLEEDFKAIVADELEEDEYTKAITKISEKLVKYILDNPELMIEPNDEDSRDYPIDYLEEHQPRYDYECELPDSVVRHLDNGDVDTGDVAWAIGDMQTNYGAISDNCDDVIVNASSQRVVIIGLTKDVYNELEDHFVDWLDNYGNDLGDEYPLFPDYDDAIDELFTPNCLNESAIAKRTITGSAFKGTSKCILSESEKSSLIKDFINIGKPVFLDYSNIIDKDIIKCLKELGYSIHEVKCNTLDLDDDNLEIPSSANIVFLNDYTQAQSGIRSSLLNAILDFDIKGIKVVILGDYNKLTNKEKSIFNYCQIKNEVLDETLYDKLKSYFSDDFKDDRNDADDVKPLTSNDNTVYSKVRKLIDKNNK